MRSLPMSGAYFSLLLRERGISIESMEALLTGTGVRAGDPLDVISVEQQLRQLHNLNDLLPGGWGLEMGLLFDATAHGAVGTAVMSAATLADALDVLTRFGHVRSPFLCLDSELTERCYRLQISPSGPLDDSELVPLVESTLVSVHRMIRRIIGEGTHTVSFEVTYRAPPWAQAYEAYLRGPVVFGASRTTLSLPAPCLSARSPFSDPHQYQSSLRVLDELVRHAGAQDVLTARVERLMAGAGVVVPSLEQVAASLFVSPRTLERRLDAAGTTYRDLVDRRRRRLAEELLADRSLTVSEVSAKLGYGDPANFGRACRRWFGTGPREHRSGLQDPGGAAAPQREPPMTASDVI